MHDASQAFSPAISRPGLLAAIAQRVGTFRTARLVAWERRVLSQVDPRLTADAGLASSATGFPSAERAW